MRFSLIPLSPIVVAVQGIPEALVQVFFVYALLGARVRPPRIVLLGLVDISVIYVVRLAGTPFPSHTLLSMIVMAVIISLWDQLALRKVILAWATILVVMLVLEVCFTVLVTHLTGITLEDLVARPLLWMLTGWSHVVVMALLALWIYRRGGIRFLKFTG